MHDLDFYDDSEIDPRFPPDHPVDRADAEAGPVADTPLPQGMVGHEASPPEVGPTEPARPAGGWSNGPDAIDGPSPAPAIPSSPRPLTAGDVSGWFQRLSQIHQQMLASQYKRESYRLEIQRFGEAIQRLQEEMGKLNESNRLLTQYHQLLNDVQTKVAEHEQMLLEQMTRHEHDLVAKLQSHAKDLEGKIQQIGNPLAKLDRLLNELADGFRVFHTLSQRAVWIIGGSVFVGTLIGNLFAVLAGV